MKNNNEPPISQAEIQKKEEQQRRSLQEYIFKLEYSQDVAEDLILSQQKSLEQTVSLLQATLESTADCILVVDLTGIITIHNQRFVTLCGFSEASLVSDEVSQVFAGAPNKLKHPEVFLDRVRALHDRPEDKSFDLLEFLDGRMCECYSQPQYLADRIVGRVWSLRDVTDQVKAMVRIQSAEAELRHERDQLEQIVQERTKELRQSEERYRLIADNTLDSIWAMDAEFNFTYLSPSTERLSGYTPREWETLDWRAIMHPDHLARVIDVFEGLRYEPDRSSTTAEALVCHKNGQKIWIEFTASPIRGRDGNFIGAVGITRDITERKQMEEEKTKLEAQLTQARKMEAIGTLAGGIAHDFNNILSAIMGFTDMTLISIPEGSEDHRNLQQVLQASIRGKELVEQILAFSRKTVRQRQPLNFATLVKETLKMLRATIFTTIEIKLVIDSSQTMLLADPIQIQQLIMNLVTNSVQAMKETGDMLEIGLKERYLKKNDLLELPDLTPGPYSILTVRDNGPGIPSEIIDKIYEPFFTTKNVGEGTGMGLAVVYGIVKAHRGGISVSSQPGDTTFTIVMPQCLSKTVEVNQDQSPIPYGFGRLLIIDDEKTLLDMMKNMLENLGYKVTTSNCSLEAIEIFRTQPHKFDLLITDQTMPQMDGMNLSQKFRRIRPNLPIILCTGFSDKGLEDTIKAAGINALLMKPFRLRDLGAMVRKVLDEENQ